MADSLTTTAGSAVAFISYAWSTPTHDAWVVQLATRLMEDGVDIKLDKWDLRPGQSTYEFMESMVLDPAITKVIMICDRTYVEKANSRTGGVGTESQIISPKIYGEGKQSKFAALIREVDENGQAIVPIFYSGRIYFDFSSADREEAAYDELFRWLVDKPRYVKPKLGSVPQHILDAKPVASGTTSRAKRAEDALRQGTPVAAANIQEYGDALIAELRSLKPNSAGNEDVVDEVVIEAIANIRPYMRQFAELCATTCRYSTDPIPFERLLRVVESIGRLMYRDEDVRQWRETDYDAYRLAAYESFLILVASAIREERFDLAKRAFTTAYLVSPNDRGSGASTEDFSVFRQHLPSLEYRKQRLGLNRVSLIADILHDAHKGGIPSFEEIMQADLIAFVRSFTPAARRASNWYPETLVYAARTFASFPVFARAESKEYFERLAPVLGVTSPDDLKVIAASIANSTKSWFGPFGLSIQNLTNTQHLASIP